jgi:hypothetical protein
MQVGIQLGREVSLQTGFSERQREAIALGYQAGNLIFPSLAPVAAWAFLSRHFLEDLSRARAPGGAAQRRTLKSRIKTP